MEYTRYDDLEQVDAGVLTVLVAQRRMSLRKNLCVCRASAVKRERRFSLTAEARQTQRSGKPTYLLRRGGFASRPFQSIQNEYSLAFFSSNTTRNDSSPPTLSSSLPSQVTWADITSPWTRWHFLS